LPVKNSPSGGELFIVDNSDEDWKVRKYLHDWCQISQAIDIATGYFEIGSLLALGDDKSPASDLTMRRSDRAFTDCRPISIFSTQTVRKIEDAVGLAVDKRRFRANIYVDLTSTEGFAEDQYVGRQLRIGGKVVLGKEVVGQPERSAIDKDRLFGPRVGQGCGKVERGLDRDPAGAPVLAMAGDAVAHLLIPGLGGGDVAAGATGAGDQLLGESGFSRPGTADDEGKGRK